MKMTMIAQIKIQNIHEHDVMADNFEQQIRTRLETGEDANTSEPPPGDHLLNSDITLTGLNGTGFPTPLHYLSGKQDIFVPRKVRLPTFEYKQRKYKLRDPDRVLQNYQL